MYSNQSLVRRLQKSNEKLDGLNSKLESSNIRLEQYAQSTSHDLRQPIRSIISFSQLLSMRIDKINIEDDKTRDYLNQITGGAMRMNGMVQELLSYSLINSDILSTEHDVHEIIEEVLLDLKEQIDSSETLLQIDAMPVVRVLRSNLAQVFQNLISNAIKYRKEDTQLMINITAEEMDGYWHFCVEDNGQGIATEHLEDIFKYRSQVDKDKDGQGIGLSTCYQIITGYHGEIWAESELGIGSKFCFTFPHKDTITDDLIN